MWGVAIGVGLGLLIVVAIQIGRVRNRLGAFELTQDDADDILGGIKPGHEDTITALVEGDTAYWITDNALVSAPVAMDGNIVFSSAKKYDAMSAPVDELRKMLLIIDTIKENT